jgi:multidrug efflux system membrane fusion protein
VGILMGLLSGMAALSACSDKASGKATVTSAVPVSVGEVVQKAVPLQLRAIGNVQAYSTVSIKSQVEGTLARVYFKEGQDVKKGDLIFLIDPRSFEAALRQAEATLARDTAQAANARLDERRFADLFKEGGVSQQQYDQARTSATALEAPSNGTDRPWKTPSSSLDTLRSAPRSTDGPATSSSIRATSSKRMTPIIRWW